MKIAGVMAPRIKLLRARTFCATTTAASMMARPLRSALLAHACLAIALLSPGVLTILSFAYAPPADAPAAGDQPTFRLEPLPQIKLPRSAPVSAAETAEIRRLIRQLAELDSYHHDFKPNYFSIGFAPVTGPESEDAIELPDPGKMRSTTFTKLVAIGPRALPFLLQAVDDPTPSKVRTRFVPNLQRWHFTPEELGSPASTRENQLWASLPKRNSDHKSRRPVPYSMSVGEICLVAIGQIVGRHYEDVMYQHSDVMVNSPSDDPGIARTVRAIWASDDPAQHLLDSLMLDYATRGIRPASNMAAFDVWDIGASPQISAVMRLLYYFPRQTVPMIAARLDKLQVQSTRHGGGSKRSAQDEEAWGKRELDNEVRTDQFIKAVSWCHEQEIQKALRSIFERAGDRDLLPPSVRALDRTSDWPLVGGKRMPILKGQPPDDQGSYGDGYNILVALLAVGGEMARPIYRIYLENASPRRCFSVCEALEPTDGKWDREFLWPMLSDKRPSAIYDHPVKANENGPRLPIRVCDLALERIVRHRTDPTWSLAGTNEELDGQIAAMQESLAEHTEIPKK